MDTISITEPKDRVISFIGMVEDSNVKAAVEKINEVNLSDDRWHAMLGVMAPSVKMERKDVPPIRILLGTYGGSVYDGFALYDAIRKSRTPVRVECIGKVMSMGIPILLAADDRVAYAHTTFMIHAVSSLAIGQLKDLEENVGEMKRVNDMIFGIIADATKIDRKTLDEVYEKKRDWFITAEEALRLGLVREIA